VNERKRLLARKQLTDPRILCVVSKKKKRNEQHNPLSPPRNERRRKEKEKEKEKERKETKKFEERKSKEDETIILQVLQIITLTLIFPL
jgi:hypothetical protein